MACCGSSAPSTRRSFQTMLSSSLDMRISSRRVPEALTSMAGKIRLSASWRDSRSSMLPVPLNSSKMTSSILRAGLDERGGEDRQRAAVLDVARGAEEPLRRVERARVDTAGEDAPAGRGREVVGAAEAGDRVEQDDDVVAQLDQPLGALDRELGDGGVVVGRAVEGRGDDLALDRALHVGDLFGPLVDEDDHEVALGVVAGDRVGDRLQDQRLAGLGRRDDQAALALADRRDEVDEPGGDAGSARSPGAAAPAGTAGVSLPNSGRARASSGRRAVDRVEPDQRVELLLAPLRLLAVALGPDGADDGVALAQAVPLDLAERDVDVVRAGQVARGAHEGVVVEHVEDARDRDEHVVLADLRLVGDDAVRGAARRRGRGACGRGNDPGGGGRDRRRPRRRRREGLPLGRLLAAVLAVCGPADRRAADRPLAVLLAVAACWPSR